MSCPQARRFAKAMRAALIFSSTSHSINVQKVRPAAYREPSTFASRDANPSILDLQNCPVQSLRSQVHDP